MKSLKYRVLTALLAVGSLMTLAQARAQEIKPAAVISIASIDKIMGDVEYLTAVGGSPDVGKLVSGMAGLYVNGVDRSKPAGAFVMMDAMEPKVTVFIPIKDLKAVLGTLKGQGIEPRDAGGGIQQFNVGDQQFFLKEQPGWAFLAPKPEQLAKLPADPSKLLAGLDQQYNVSARINMQYVPKDLKQTAINFIRSQSEAQLRDLPDAGNREALEKLQRASLNSYVALIEETDQITVGWGVDKTLKSTFIDFTMTAVEGTTTAKRMAMASEAKSGFAGFLAPDAAVTFNLSQKLLKEDIDQYSGLLKPLRAQALKEIDNDSSIQAEQRAEVKEVLGSLIDVLQGTLESGKIDAGASLFVEPKMLTFVAGLYVADGMALEKSIRKGAAVVAKTEPEAPKVNFDVEKHAGVNFHTLSIPIPASEDEARQLLGEKLDVVLGTGAKAFYIAFGKNTSATLKKVIDKSTSDATKTVPPLQLNVSLTPIAKLAASTNSNPLAGMIAAALEKTAGKDHVRITTKPIPRGITSRVELEEGVIQAIGQGAKAAQAGGRPPF